MAVLGSRRQKWSSVGLSPLLFLTGPHSFPHSSSFSHSYLNRDSPSLAMTQNLPLLYLPDKVSLSTLAQKGVYDVH